MAMPAGIAAVTLTGRYVHPDGTPYAGSVTISAPDVIRLPDADITAMGTVTVALDGTGAFSVIVVATDNADSRPTNFTYTVTESLTGIPTRTYSIALPQATPTVDLADIAPAVASGGEVLLVTGPAGKTILSGTTAPSSGTGTNGDFYLDSAAWSIYGPKASGTWPSGHALGSGGAVASVAGKTGTVSLVPADVPGVATTSGVTSAVSAAIGTEVTRADGAYLAKEGNLSEISDPAVARTNLGITPGAIGALTSATAASTYSPLTTTDTGVWVYNVAHYGAVGDGKMVSDGAMTSGSAALACTTSTPFVSGDVGKKIMVKGAGATGVTTHVATISAFTDSGHVTLSASASTTVTGALVMWATDDTAAIQAAINAAVTWAQANSGSARVFFPAQAGFYGVAGALVTSGSTKGNSQLTLPVVASTARKVSLTLEGVTTGAALQHWEQLVPQVGGSTLVSFGINAGISAQSTAVSTNGNPCVIGGPAQPGGYGVAPGVYSNMLITLKSLSILTAYSLYGLTYTAADFSGVANAMVEDVAYGTTGTVPAGDYSSVNQFANGLSIGLLMPANGNNDHCIIRNTTCHGGYTYAVYATEHTVIPDTMRLLYCWSAFCVVGLYFGSVGATHAIKAAQLSIEACTNVVMIVGAGSDGIGPFLDIDQLDTETSNPTFADTTSGTSLAAALGTVKLTGLYTAANVTVAHPTGLRITDGQNPAGVRTLSGAATVRVTDRYLICATASAFTVTLISAVATPNVYSFRNTGANTLTVAAAASQTIDGSATKSVAAGASLTLVPSGGNWVSV